MSWTSDDDIDLLSDGYVLSPVACRRPLWDTIRTGEAASVMPSRCPSSLEQNHLENDKDIAIARKGYAGERRVEARAETWRDRASFPLPPSPSPLPLKLLLDKVSLRHGLREHTLCWPVQLAMLARRIIY